MSRNYTQAPLPFQGQKRRFVKEFKKRLKVYRDGTVFVDLFGGSGLLSHTAKVTHPNSTVIYNDFDNYSQRLSVVNETNLILDSIRNCLKNYPEDKIIVGEVRDSILKILKVANQKDFVDWITLSSSLMFSMKYGKCYDDFRKSSLYNCVRKSNYAIDGYLEGVDVVRMDYRELFEKYKENNQVVFFVDPPYLSTDSSTYDSNGYWKLKDYLDVLNVIYNQNYFYFTSNKSQIVELCEWISSVSLQANPFENAECVKISTNVSHTAKYIDIMYHYKKE